MRDDVAIPIRERIAHASETEIALLDRTGQFTYCWYGTVLPDVRSEHCYQGILRIGHSIDDAPV